MPNDADLMARYVKDGDALAFGALVERHAGMVYGVCRRILGDAHAAEDAGQAVFLLLTRKAAGLKPQVSLTGWLYRAAVLAACEARRNRATRERHEREAATMRAQEDSPDAGAALRNWEQIAPNLDAMLERLPSDQRDALVLRYLSGLSEADAARELDCPVGTLSARVSRGLERLRVLFGGGTVLPAGALAAALASHGSPSAPAAFASSVQSVCLGKAAATAITLAITEAVMKTMFWIKVKFAAACVALALVLGAGAPLAYRALASEAAPSAVPPPKTGEAAAQAPAPESVPEKVRFTPGYTTANLQYERISRTELKRDKETLTEVETYFMDKFMDYQIYDLKIEKDVMDKRLSFSCNKVTGVIDQAGFARATGQAADPDHARDTLVITFDKFENNQKLSTFWNLVKDQRIELKNTELQFVPIGNAFIGMGFMSLDMGFSGPVCIAGDQPRAVGDSWKIPVVLPRQEKKEPDLRTFHLAKLERNGGVLLATVKVDKDTFKVKDPKMLPGKIKLLGHDFDYTLGVEVEGETSGEYLVDVERGVVLKGAETMDCKMNLTIKLADDAPEQIKNFVGKGIVGHLVVQNQDRLLEAEEGHALSGEPAKPEAIAELRKRWQPLTQAKDDAFMVALAQNILSKLDIVAKQKPAKPDDF
ncbi:MAG: RNA polymerase sigma factor [Planctomycetes bacterium]|nr:RNA polymerase sigma factor [Planctomycetota bacterium]